MDHYSPPPHHLKKAWARTCDALLMPKPTEPRRDVYPYFLNKPLSCVVDSVFNQIKQVKHGFQFFYCTLINERTTELVGDSNL